MRYARCDSEFKTLLPNIQPSEPYAQKQLKQQQINIVDNQEVTCDISYT